MKSARTIFLLALALGLNAALCEGRSALWRAGVSLIPYPQEVRLGGEDFVFGSTVAVSLDKGADETDRFTAGELAARLKADWGIEVVIGTKPGARLIVLTRSGAPEKVGEQGYRLEAIADRLTVRANSAAGLFYGVQTLLQMIQKGRSGPYVPGAEITDWPDIKQRAVHYDTKHFQEKATYVRDFIRTLARYKINMLICEWEDKLAYQRHPEIGAPGAFTMKEMQEFTSFARKYHIQIVPLVQGLGHVSFIQKHPQHRALREIPSSNWQNNALDEGTYELMFDLWEETIEATPGSEYIHIGTDEAWELGKGATKKKAEEIGTYGLMIHFIRRAHDHLAGFGRKVMSWGGGYRPEEEITPPKGLITFGWRSIERDKTLVEAGYPVYIYDPNPGIEHMFLPYFYRIRRGEEVPGCLEVSYKTISSAALSGIYDGTVATSWNCSGVHNQIWMLRYIVAAEYSWSGYAPGYEEFKTKYFKNYYGPDCRDMHELFLTLNKASYFYMNSFERKVWHWGEVGKTHLPGLPRDDVEYDPYWNTEYRERVALSRAILPQMERVKNICRTNLALGAKNEYDFELFMRLSELFSHTANTYLALSALERAITQAHRTHFDNHQEAYASLERAARIVEENLAERDEVYKRLKATWEKTQLPKGMSTAEKKYVHARDRQRNFANRRPDMSFVIYDEQLLGLEDYLDKLREYMKWYRKNYFLAGEVR